MASRTTCEDCDRAIEPSPRRRLCPACREVRRRDTKRAWAKRNPEKIREKSKREAPGRHAYFRAYMRDRYAADPERFKAKAKVYYGQNADDLKAKRRTRYHAQPEREAAWNRAWLEANRDHFNEHQAEYRRRTGLNTRQSRTRRAQLATAPGTHTQQEFVDLCAELDGRCIYCWSQPDEMTLDHVVPLSRGGADSIDNIVPACRSCNASKSDRTPEEWIASAEASA